MDEDAPIEPETDLELWPIARVAKELGGLTIASARKEMARAGIRIVSGYPAVLVRIRLKQRARNERP